MSSERINVSDFHKLLKLMVSRDASDLFFTAGVPASFKINGVVKPVTDNALDGMQVDHLARSLMNDQQREQFDTTQECNFALAAPNIGRFRVNIFCQKNTTGMVLRRIKTEIPTFETLDITPSLGELVMAKRGLIIIVGATGSGKSSTLAAMVGHRNRNSHGHIITIEDPVEYVHEHAGCIITQREVGVDTATFESALQNTLRQAPDVILIGEVRSRETMEHALTFAETGHLVLTTLHANNANQAIDRIINFFPKDRRDQVLLDLSLNLKAIIAQQLIRNVDLQGRCVAMEILINTPLVAQLIRDGNVSDLKGIMGRSNQLGMITFDQALFNLFKAKKISYDDALRHADSENEIRLMIKLAEKDGLKKIEESISNVTLVNIDDK